MKSAKELKKIKDACENKRNNFDEGHSEYVRLSDCIISLEKQINNDHGANWSWDDVAGEDGYVGDGIYAPGSKY